MSMQLPHIKFAIKPTEVVVRFEVLFYIKVTATQSYLIFQVVNFFKGNTDTLKRQNGWKAKEVFHESRRGRYFYGNVELLFLPQGCVENLDLELISRNSSGNWCYKTAFGGNLENLDLPLNWNKTNWAF